MHLFRRKPDWSKLAATRESAEKVLDRKGLAMVEYLRARRSNDPLKGFFRALYFQESRHD